jgi:hypothetical protein
MGEKLPTNFAVISRVPLQMKGSFTCRKATTWDRRLYFPSEGRHAEEFFALKNPTASAGFEPAIFGTRGQHANHQTTEAASVGKESVTKPCQARPAGPP